MAGEPQEPLLLAEAGNEEKVRRHVRFYLGLTGQWFPHKLTWKVKILYAVLQFFVLAGITTYFVYALGVWGTRRNKVTEDFVNYPITVIERTMWEFRWLVTGYLGITVCNNVLGEFFENEHVSLTDARWKNVKHVLWGLETLLVLISIVSNICNLCEIDFHVTSNNAPGILLDATFIFLNRLFTFPLFLAFCLVAYILGSMAKQYCKDIKQWPAGENDENDARERFRKIKKCIRSAGLSFQLYLSIHFLLLFCTFFLGVCSCFEQMEVRISENITMTSPLLTSHYSRALMFGSNTSTESLLTSFVEPNHANGRGLINESLGGSEELFETKWMEQSMKMIAIDMVVKTLESLFLYLVPVGLMVRLENQLRCVAEAIEDSKCDEQERQR